MTDSFDEMKRELTELLERMRSSRITLPVPEGLTPAEARTMVALYRLHDHCGQARPGRVAEVAHTTPSALSQTFKVLEEKGLIKRRRADDDYRAVTVSLTEAGESCALEGVRLHDEHMRQMFDYLGLEDMSHLVRILRKVVEFHEQLSQENPAGQAGEATVRSQDKGYCCASTPHETSMDVDDRPPCSEGADAPCA